MTLMIDASRLQDSASRRQDTASRSKDSTLVEGTFRAPDALEFASALLEAARQVHKLRNLRAQVHTEALDADATLSIGELEAAGQELYTLMRSATLEGRQVRMRASIELEFVDEPFRR